MTAFKQQCEEFFGTSDFYEVLGVPRTATDKQIKKAYHKLSLLVHPDRVEESAKAVATEKFKVLGKIHSVLQNEEKRKCYDDSGEIDSEDNDNDFNWMEYWRSMFKKIELKDIEKYEKEFIGSETELRDIKKAYVASKGNMDVILEMVPFSNCDSEPRIIEIVRKMVDDGEVEEYKAFFNEPKAKKLRRRRKYDREKKESEEIKMETLEQEMQQAREKRGKSFIDMLSNIEAKYGGKKRKSITNGSPAKKSRTKK